MMDSPYDPYSDTRFTINEKGADDMEEDALSKRSQLRKAAKRHQQQLMTPKHDRPML